VFETLEGTGEITPVYVEGAEPGDTLVVDVVSSSTAAGAGTGSFPDFGLLAGEFEKPYIHYYLSKGHSCGTATQPRRWGGQRSGIGPTACAGRPST
jgi:acetamidase/formamidase